MTIMRFYEHYNEATLKSNGLMISFQHLCRLCFRSHGAWFRVPLPLLQQAGWGGNRTRVIFRHIQLHGGPVSGSQPADHCAVWHQRDDQLTLPQTQQ